MAISTNPSTNPSTMPPACAAARTVEACKIYGKDQTEVRALDGVTVAFEQGRFTAIMGPPASRSRRRRVPGNLPRAAASRQPEHTGRSAPSRPGPR